MKTVGGDGRRGGAEEGRYLLGGGGHAERLSGGGADPVPVGGVALHVIAFDIAQPG